MSKKNGDVKIINKPIDFANEKSGYKRKSGVVQGIMWNFKTR